MKKVKSPPYARPPPPPAGITSIGALIALMCGNIASTGCIDVESSPVIYREVTRALENLVLTNELHLLYLVTPLDIRDSIEPQWMTYFKQVRSRQKYAKKSVGM